MSSYANLLNKKRLALAVTLILITSVFVCPTQYADADNLIVGEECTSEGWLATITDFEGNPLSSVKLLTVKEMRSSGYEELFFTDDKGTALISFSSITGFVKITKGGYTDRILSISCDLSTKHTDKIESGFLRYTDPLFGIKIDYPSNWQKDTSNPNFRVALISPEESDANVYLESVAIMTQSVEFDNPADLALSYTSSMSTNMQGFQLLENVQTTIGGHPAQTIVFTSTMQGIESKVIVYFTIVDGIGYMIFFDVEPINYQKYLPIFKQMVESVKIESMSVSEIPDWIRNNAKWWVEGTIDDQAFVGGIQFLVKEGVIPIPETTQSTTNTSQEIPSWIKNNADWWSQGLISDDDFLKGIQFMVEKGIITVA